jgi:type III secretion HrpO family protein
MPIAALVHSAQQGLFLVVAVSLPVLAVATAVGFLIAALQAASQIQDSTLAHLPRMVVVAVALAIAGPWMGRTIAAFAAQMFTR